jgi:hypothetical protein
MGEQSRLSTWPDVNVLTLQHYVNQQTQHNTPNILVLHAALQHVPAAYISDHQAGIGSQKQ